MNNFSTENLMVKDVFQPLSDEELDLLSLMLLDATVVADDDLDANGIYTISDLDGFFTAIVSSPLMIHPSSWFPRLLDYKELAFETDEEKDVFFMLLTRFYNETIMRLDNPAHYFSLFDEAEKYIIVEDWCYGYLIGKELVDWQTIPTGLVPYFNVIEEKTKVLPKTAKESKRFAQQVQNAAMMIYQYSKRNLRM